jgi:hypothetical protein
VNLSGVDAAGAMASHAGNVAVAGVERGPEGSPAKRQCSAGQLMQPPPEPQADSASILSLLREMRHENNVRSDRIEQRLDAQSKRSVEFEAHMKQQHQALCEEVAGRLEEVSAAQRSEQAESERRYAEVIARIEALERKKQVPPVPVWPDAWQPAGGHDPSTRAGSVASSSRAASTAQHFSLDRDDKFVPQVGWLRGWSPYAKKFSERTGGLTKTDADLLLARVKTVCKDCEWDIICRTSAPNFRNYQISLHIREGVSESRIYDFAKRINELLKSNQVTMNTHNVYFTLEQPVWKRLRNTKLRHIRELLTASLPSGKFEIDWSLGSVWAEREGRDPVHVYASEKKSPVGKFLAGALQGLGIVEADFLTALAGREADDS